MIKAINPKFLDYKESQNFPLGTCKNLCLSFSCSCFSCKTVFCDSHIYLCIYIYNIYIYIYSIVCLSNLLVSGVCGV